MKKKKTQPPKKLTAHCNPQIAKAEVSECQVYFTQAQGGCRERQERRIISVWDVLELKERGSQIHIYKPFQTIRFIYINHSISLPVKHENNFITFIGQS